ncbi:MAG: hypothetical protein GPJ52_14060 [Candidatus Heimdallarchaeota archaeon]|nr:hypothetical protein [Candidatus Heimdallarchaeota archaeon]
MNKKSKSKHKLTKDGLSLLENLTADSLTDAEIQTTITYLINSRIVDQINSLLIGESNLTKERLVTTLLKETNLSLQAIRTTIKDILDLLVSAQIIGIKEGTIVKYV